MAQLTAAMPAETAAPPPSLDMKDLLERLRTRAHLSHNDEPEVSAATVAAINGLLAKYADKQVSNEELCAQLDKLVSKKKLREAMLVMPARYTVGTLSSWTVVWEALGCDKVEFKEQSSDYWHHYPSQ